MLSIKNLSVQINNKQVLHNVNLVIKSGEIHAIMGPNGAGKTSLAMVLMGNPEYQFRSQKSEVRIDGKDINFLTPDERARKGLFVSFQNPVEISGVSFLAFLRTAYKALHAGENIPLKDFRERVKAAFLEVGLEESFMQRSINEGFSGGEKKRAEVVQLLVLKPRFAVLDEIDSGLDIDSLKIVAKAIAKAVRKNGTGVVLITHYQRILHYVKPDFVHALVDGKIKESDGIALVKKIERDGYAALLR